MTDIISANQIGVSGGGGGSDGSIGGIAETLSNEITQNMGIGSSQNTETGVINKGGNNLEAYSTKLFGAPFQLLDSVDTRFPEVNPQVS